MNDNASRQLLDLRENLQKLRIGMGNRVVAAHMLDERTEEEKALFTAYHERFIDIEKSLEKDIKRLNRRNEIATRVKNIRGIADILAIRITALIDIHRADSVSALWRYAGYGVSPSGERDKPVKGEKLTYNIRLKTTLHVMAESFIKLNSPYKSIYETQKQREYAKAAAVGIDLEKISGKAKKADQEILDKNPQVAKSKGHAHNRAMRKMIKIFLSHLWLEWRKLESLPVTDAYVHDKLGHTHIMKPEDFGW